MHEALMKKLAKPMLVLAPIIWGSTFFIIKDTLDAADPMFLLAPRFTFAAVVLSLLFRRRFKGLDRSCWRRGGLMGVFLAAAYIVQIYGLTGTTPGKNAFFTAVYCVIVPFLYWVVDKKRPDRYNVLAALLCVAGVGFVSWDGGLALSWGDALTLCGGFLFACHIVAVAKFSQGRDIIPLTVIQFASTAVCCWIGAFATRGIPTRGLPARAWLVLLYLALFSTTIGQLFQNLGQAYTDPASAALLLSLEAPFGVLFSVVFTDEAPTAFMYLGFALIFIAIVCSETKFQFFKPKRERVSQ